ncbi:MAG: fructosamine kinase family protein [Sulfurovum sp.]|nr:fructosamine kinase family protein [Sulfurovum sp.]
MDNDTANGSNRLKERLHSVLDKEILSIDFLTKGQVGDVFKVVTSDKICILKTSESSNTLQIESEMLSDINKYDISVPKVFDVSERHLLMEYIDTSDVSKYIEEVEAAKILSTLHSITNESRMYGYYYDTTIGPFRQKNEQTQYNWILFLTEMRILPMVKICYNKSYLSKQIVQKIENLCSGLYKRIDMSKITPSLLHGDLWSGNILFQQKKAVLIDPAIYYGDKEMELAFILMFNTFGDDFFNVYTRKHTLSEDFHDVKVPIYQIYPLLVHIALYKGTYIRQLEETLRGLKI